MKSNMKRAKMECDNDYMKSERLYVKDGIDEKSILHAYYHLHKNDEAVKKQLGEKYTWRDIKKITDAMYLKQ